MPNRRTLLILGASAYQIPFIEAAKLAGHRVLTADNRPQNKGHALADASFDCDTTNIGAITALAQRERVHGILAAATDVALEAAATAAATLGLRAPTPECVRVLTRKRAFRQFQSKLGLPGPILRGNGDVVWPCIVKPNRASGSKGIRIVTRPEDLDASLAAARAESVDGDAIIEDFVDATQGTIEGIMRGGRIAACLTTDRFTAPAPFVATRAHRTPSSLTQVAMDDLHAQVATVFSALGYADGPFDGDFMVVQGRAQLIEVTPRAGGNSLVRLMKAAAGFDMPAYAVAMALGEDESVSPFRERPASVQILGVDSDGRLDYDMEAAAALATEPWVEWLQLDYPPGTRVERFRDGRCRVGELLVVGDTAEQITDRLQRAAALLQVTSKP